MKHGKTVGVFSLEMSHQQLFLRLLCGEGHVNAHHLRTGRIGAMSWLSESPTVRKVTRLRSDIRSLRLSAGVVAGPAEASLIG